MSYYGKRRRTAYYGANHGNEFSKSLRASDAESEGRWPRTRAAAVLGVSIKAFDAGCTAAGYRSTEWHHSGKYAMQVDYYDTNVLRDSPEFWQGCADTYKAKATKAECLAAKAQALERTKADRIEAFKAKLLAQRDCSRPKPAHRKDSHSWEHVVWDRCGSKAQPVYIAWLDERDSIPPGDFVMLENKMAWHVHTAEEKASHAEWNNLCRATNHLEDQLVNNFRAQRRHEAACRKYEIPGIVPQINRVSGGKFVLLLDAEVVEASEALFHRQMSEAQIEAVLLGWNGVTIHKRDGGVMGWIPCRWQYKPEAIVPVIDQPQLLAA